MKINDGFVLRKIGDSYYAVPTESDSTIGNGMIKLNETGNFIWNKLTVGCEKEALVDAVVAEYEVTREKAVADIDAFIERLVEVGILGA